MKVLALLVANHFLLLKLILWLKKQQFAHVKNNSWEGEGIPE